MIVLIFLAILSIFVTLSRRKLGYFTLALFAGYVLNQFWNAEIVAILTPLGLNIPRATLSGFVGLGLIFSPAFVILAKNPKQENWLAGAISSIFTSVLALCLAVSSLSRVFAFDLLSENLSASVESFSKYLVLAGVILSILSIISFKLKKLDEKS